MAGWAGFTDEDLKRMKQGPSGETVSQRQAQLKRQRIPNRERLIPSSKTQGLVGKTNSHVPLDPSQALSHPEEPKAKTNGTRLSGHPDRGAEKTSNSHPLGKQEVSDKSSSDTPPDIKKEPKLPHQQEEKEPSRELDETEALRAEMDNVAKFQKQQKMIEEANKQKREYLAKAISERKKKAKAESEKLGKIQVELNRLDTLLSGDVSVIRDKIEAASLEYMDAQRRYARAEQDFINAKMALFEKGELKERLTEHLYTIIHQNEVRKANKLAELMKQLEMEVAQDEVEVATPSIPMLTNFNSVATLHNPAHKSPLSSPEAGKTIDLNKKDCNQCAGDQKTKTESVQVKSEETNNNEKEQSREDNSGKTEVPAESNETSKQDCKEMENLSHAPGDSPSATPGDSIRKAENSDNTERGDSSSVAVYSVQGSDNPDGHTEGKS